MRVFHIFPIKVGDAGVFDLLCLRAAPKRPQDSAYLRGRSKARFHMLLDFRGVLDVYDSGAIAPRIHLTKFVIVVQMIRV